MIWIFTTQVSDLVTSKGSSLVEKMNWQTGAAAGAVALGVALGATIYYNTPSKRTPGGVR